MARHRRSRRLSATTATRNRPAARKPIRPRPLRFEMLEDRRVLSLWTPEIEPNDTLQTATALPLTEDPLDSGYLVGRGAGSIDPADDQDWWSFEASAGDLVSVSVDTPESSLDPSVVLYDAAGNWLASDSWSGPGNDAFISRYEIPTSGTYYVQVHWGWSSTGAYELRVDLARGIDLESDAGYANDTIAGANVLDLVRAVPGELKGTVAGTIMWGPGVSTPDQDLFDLGTLSAGNVVELDVRLPSTSTLNPFVTLLDAEGLPVANEGPAGESFVGTIPADGPYYARLESPLAWSYGGDLYVLTDEMTWSEADAHAQSLSGNLVTVGDAAENAWLLETFGGFGAFWIGLTDEAVEGEWVWTSGQEVTYTNWGSGYPHNNTDYNWAYMWPDGLWYDAAATWTYRAVVEIEGGAPEPVGPGPWAQYLLDVTVTDTVSPSVRSVRPLPEDGGTTSAVVDRLEVTFSKEIWTPRR